MTWLVAYAAVAVIFLVLDAIWLGFVARDFYADQLGDLMRDKPDFGVAGLFYLVYAAGIVLFAVQPGLQAQSWRLSLGYGAALGFLAYGTYDMTNLATIRGWPVTMAVVDIAWGTAVTALTAGGAVWILRAAGVGQTTGG